MAIPAILQGDDSGAITIALADGHTYDGATLVVVFNGVSRQYTNLTAGGSVSLVFTAEETAGMPLGTAPLLMRLVGANGGVETVGNAAARIKVTDCVAEVSAGGSFAVTPGGNPLEGVAGLGTRYTGDQLRAKINEVIAKLGGTVAALLLCALPCLGDVLEVQTAPLGGIYSDERVVTNVTFDASAVVPGDYANVSNAAMNAVQQGSRNWMDVERKMGAIAATDDEFIPWCFMGSAYFADELVWPGDGYNYHLVYDESAMRWITWYAPPGSEDMIDEEAGRFLTQEDIAYLSDIPAQQDLSGYATKRYADGAASSAVTPVSNKVETTAAIVDSWESYWGATNVELQVTNYYGNTTGALPRLRIREFRDGHWTNVWDEIDKFIACKAEILHDVAQSNETVLAAVKAKYSPKAWGAYTDKGTTNVIPNSVYMSSPETYFGGGTEFQRVAVGSGAVSVLVDRGALAKTTGEPGTFRFQDAGGTNYFGFVKSDSYTIGCRTDGISVGAGNAITLRYDVIMSGEDVPVVYWKQKLEDPTPWAQLNNPDGTAADGAPYVVTWLQDGGSYYATVNCGGSPSGFFVAETSVAGDVVWETNMKARLGGGIECTNTATHVNGVIRPSYNGSTVTWEWRAR